MDKESDFILAKSSKRRKNKKLQKDFTPLSFSQKLDREAALISSHPEWLENTRGIINNAISAMGWTKPSKLLCLGLGSPCDSRSARLQLALAKYLMEYFNIPPKDGHFYDPVFTDEDLEGLKALGFEVLNGQIETDTPHVLTEPTIVFMPHCGIALNESILKSNWSPEGINNLLLLGNSLYLYLLVKSTNDLDKNYPCIKAMAGNTYWHSKDLIKAPFDEKAFNALSVQYFPAAEAFPLGDITLPE